MRLHLLGLALATVTACYNPDQSPPDGGPSTDGGTLPDSSTDVDASVDTLPPGVSLLVEGHFVQIARHVPNGKLIAVEYESAAILAQPRRIVSIHTQTGTVEELVELAGRRPPYDLQASDTAVFWLENADAGITLYRRLLTANASAEPVLVPGLSNLPAGYKIGTYALDPANARIFVMLENGSRYELGSIAIGSTPNSNQYTTFMNKEVVGASSVSANAGVNRKMVVRGGRVYAGLQATIPNMPGQAFVQMYDIAQNSSQTLTSDINAILIGFGASNNHVYWLAQRSSAESRLFVSGNNGTGEIAKLPLLTYSAVMVNNEMYAAISGSSGAELHWVPMVPPSDDPPDTTTRIVSIQSCEGQPSTVCSRKINLLATDGTSVYMTATTAIYKYTKQ